MLPWTGRPSRGAAFLAAVATLLGERVAAQQVTYAGSLSYSTGSYVFVDRTHSLWLSNGLTMSAGRMSVSASLPVIVQNSGVVSFVAGQPVPTGGESNGAVRDRGGGRIGSGAGPGASATADSVVVFRDAYEVQVGDPLALASVELYDGSGFVRGVSITGGAKAPLRSLESGVGTGAWDWGSGASLAFGHGSTLLLADVTYWWFGDLPDLALDPSLMYAVSVSRVVLGARGSVSASLAGATSVIDTVDPPLSVGLGFLYLMEGGRAVSIGANAGLSEGSPDVTAYLGWTLPL